VSPPGREQAPAASAGRRLDEVVAALAGVSRAAAARWVEDGRVLFAGRPRAKSHRLRGGEALAWEPPPEAPAGPPAPEARQLVVRYEDERLLVVAKPAGLVVHPAPGHPAGTLVNALLGREGSLSSAGGEDRPGIVHRLDKDTSGLLLVAKDDATHLALVRELAAHRIERRYLALAQGHLPAKAGTVDAPIGRNPRDRKRMAVVPGGRPALTSWRVRERLPGTDLVEASLQTGRTHQIRVHLAHLRHPVAGDRAYGADPRLAASIGLDRPFLHAWRLAFDHPADGRRIELTEPLPDDLQAALERLRDLAGRRQTRPGPPALGPRQPG
jgi:23S rRNA pseudouridine1911/1915/1917 synthase